MEKTYKTLKIAIWVLAFAVVLAGAWVLYNNLGQLQGSVLMTETTAPGTAEEPERELAPDFTFYDQEGNAHKLSDFRGKPVLLNFWASWCGPCQNEMPHFQKAYEQYGEDMHFLLVDQPDGRETQEKALAYVADQGFTFPVYFDNDWSGAIAYGVYAIPVSFLLDAEGYVVTSHRGEYNAETLQAAIDMVLEK